MTSLSHRNINFDLSIIMTSSLTKKAAGAVVTVSLLMPMLAFAQVGVTPTAEVSASVAVKIDARGERAKVKAAQEIDRRLAALQSLASRITAMTKITPELKSNFSQVVQNQSRVFADLKVKIGADTDLTVLKTDIKSITDSYRVYAIVVPQTHIIAASDRIVTITNMLNGIGLKLKARIEAAQAAGADVTAVGTTLGELGTKIDSANAHARAAVEKMMSIVPEDGDKAKMDANKALFTESRAEIVAAHKDLADARKAVASIISGLATLQVTTSASTSAGAAQ